MESAVAYNRVDLPSKATYGESNTKQDYESGIDSEMTSSPCCPIDNYPLSRSSDCGTVVTTDFNQPISTLPHPFEEQLSIDMYPDSTIESTIDIMTTPTDDDLGEEIPYEVINQPGTDPVNDSFSLCYDDNDSVSVSSNEEEPSSEALLVALDLETDIRLMEGVVIHRDQAGPVGSQMDVDTSRGKFGCEEESRLGSYKTMLNIIGCNVEKSVLGTSLVPSSSLSSYLGLGPSTSLDLSTNLGSSMSQGRMSLGPYSNISHVPCPPGVEISSFLNKSISPKIALIRSPFKLQSGSRSSSPKSAKQKEARSGSSPLTPEYVVKSAKNSRVKRNILKKMNTCKPMTRTGKPKNSKICSTNNLERKQSQTNAITVNIIRPQKKSPQMVADKRTIINENSLMNKLHDQLTNKKAQRKRGRDKAGMFTRVKKRECILYEPQVTRPSVSDNVTNVLSNSEKKSACLKKVSRTKLPSSKIKKDQVPIQHKKGPADDKEAKRGYGKESGDNELASKMTCEVGLHSSKRSSLSNNLHRSVQLNSDKKNAEDCSSQSQEKKESSSKQNGGSDMNKESPDKGKKRRSRPSSRRHSGSERSEETASPGKKWKCEFCGLGNNRKELGYLYGPYEVKETTDSNHLVDKEESRIDKERVVWVHAACVYWSPWMCLVGDEVIGLDEAVVTGTKTVCESCGNYGAILCCDVRSCRQCYHYPCAVEKDCVFHSEKFTITCSKHLPVNQKLSEN